MKTTLLTKAALCICPPAVMATTVATVPQVRSAIHSATAPKHRGQVHRATLASGPKRNPGATNMSADSSGTGAQPCPPGLLRVGGPYVPGPNDLTLTPTGPDDGPDGPGVTRPPLIGPPTRIVPTDIIPTGIFNGAVPEPATWLTMMAGFGLIGAMLRGRRQLPAGAPRVREGRYGRYGRSRTRSRLGTGAKLLALGDLVTSPVYSSVNAGMQSLKTGLLAKAAMCVCPPAVIAMTAIAVPPVRQAVYQATAPVGAVPAVVTPDPDVPCLPVADANTIVTASVAPELPAIVDAARVVPVSLAAAIAAEPPLQLAAR